MHSGEQPKNQMILETPKKPKILDSNQRSDNPHLLTFKGKTSSGRNIRGSYQKFTSEEKTKAINLALKMNNYAQAADILQIPKKNLKRWVDRELEKKEKGEEGKLDSFMLNWIDTFQKNFERFPAERLIKEKAFEFSSGKKMKFHPNNQWYEGFMMHNYPFKIPKMDKFEEPEEDDEYFEFKKNQKSIQFI